MARFATKVLPASADAVAPDGSEVRLLHSLAGGGMAHFELAPRQVSSPIQHKTVEEIWYFVSGRGQMWRRDDATEQIVDVFPGVSITIPVGTAFQFCSTSDVPLAAVGQTMPPWPGEDEALGGIEGPWAATVGQASD